MSIVSALVAAYRIHVALPSQEGLSAAERVWMLVYPPDQDRRLRANLDELELATKDHGRTWATVDVTDSFGRWLAHHQYAEAFVSDPSDLTFALLEEFEEYVAQQVKGVLDSSPTDSVVALIGAGSLFPFVRVSRVIDDVEPSLRGCLLVLFPGQVDQTTHTYRLLGARDGFSYRAVAITT